jgi:glycerate 2-kinase
VIVVAAPDKFRGSAAADVVVAAIAAAAEEQQATCRRVAMADGGEGTLDALGGANRSTVVAGPLGEPVEAPWRLDPAGTAVIESARACGLALLGGRPNDPIAATTRGVGELVVAAVRAGAHKVIIGLGGSATSDGGAGAAEAIAASGVALEGVELVVCCDVTTPFTDAATVFAPQKGATPEQVRELTARLEQRRRDILAATGIDLDAVPGSGAAGGLAGGLAALGAELVPGFDAIAVLVGLDDALTGADLVVTGEGRVDATSLRGKVVGGVLDRAHARGVPVLVVAGQVDAGIDFGREVDAVDLSATFGADRSYHHTAECVRLAVAAHLTRKGVPQR